MDQQIKLKVTYRAALISGIILVPVLAAIIFIIVFGSSFLKYKKEPLTTIFVNTVLYYFYFWARGISILSLAGMRKIHKRTR